MSLQSYTFIFYGSGPCRTTPGITCSIGIYTGSFARKGAFFRLLVYERVSISIVVLNKRIAKHGAFCKPLFLGSVRIELYSLTRKSKVLHIYIFTKTSHIRLVVIVLVFSLYAETVKTNMSKVRDVETKDIHYTTSYLLMF